MSRNPFWRRLREDCGTFACGLPSTTELWMEVRAVWIQETPLFAEGPVKVGWRMRRRITAPVQRWQRETAVLEFAMGERELDFEQFTWHQARIVDATGAIRHPNAGFPGRFILGVDTSGFELQQHEGFGYGNVSQSVLRFTRPRAGEKPGKTLVWTLTWQRHRGQWLIIGSHACLH